MCDADDCINCIKQWCEKRKNLINFSLHSFAMDLYSFFKTSSDFRLNDNCELYVVSSSDIKWTFRLKLISFSFTRPSINDASIKISTTRAFISYRHFTHSLSIFGSHGEFKCDTIAIVIFPISNKLWLNFSSLNSDIFRIYCDFSCHLALHCMMKSSYISSYWIHREYVLYLTTIHRVRWELWVKINNLLFFQISKLSLTLKKPQARFNF